jgi:3-phytase
MSHKSFAMTFRHLMSATAPVALAIGLSACAPLHSELVSDSQILANGTGAPVLASAETTAVGSKNLDSADDPEVWVNPANPSEALIIATDKKAGLYLYTIDGSVADFVAHGPLNNVDLRNTAQGPLVAASDRVRNGVALFRLTAAHKIETLAFLPLATSEAYGFCMGAINGATVVAVVGINGDVAIAKLSVDGGYTLSDEKRFTVGSQSEGCVIDDLTGQFYVGEEAKGIWQYDLNDWASVGANRTRLAAAPSEMLKPDVEGLTILRDGAKTYLIASSQGDSAFAIWRIDGPAPVYSGRFSVYPGNGIDAVTGTDGVAALGGQVGPYPNGVIVMQDDSDTDLETPTSARARQNFKVVDWNNVKAALKLD